MSHDPSETPPNTEGQLPSAATGEPEKAADHTGAPSSAAAAPMSGPSATDAAPAEASPHAGEGAEPHTPDLQPRKSLLARLLGR